MTTSDVRKRASEAADAVAASAKRLADRLGSRGVNLSIHIDRVVVGDEQRVLDALADAKEQIMALLDALRAAQGESKQLLLAAAGVIEEINTDLSDLLARLGNAQPGSQEIMDATAEANEIKASLSAAVDALRSAAGRYTPGQTEPPAPGALSLTCPRAQTVAVADGETDAAVTFDQPVVLGGVQPVNVSMSHTSGSRFPVGDTTVTATATDAAGASASCSFVITVVQP